MSESYLKPPIIEAVIELQLLNSIDVAKLGQVARKLKSHYSSCQEEQELQVHAEFNAGQIKQSHSSKKIGHRLTSADNSEIVLIHINRFLISKLAPYPGWPIFIKRASRDWSIWQKVVKSFSVGRIGVRFINRIDIPIDGDGEIRPHDYLSIYPHIPDIGLPKLDGYKMQISKPLGEKELRIQINTALVPSPLSRHISFLLDIDVYFQSTTPIGVPKIWKIIEEMREYKNRLFEACITDKSRELFRA